MSPSSGRGVSVQLGSFPATIPDLLVLRQSRPDDVFLIGPDFRLTFGEADIRSHNLAGRLMAAGVGKGSRVGLLYPNGPEWAIAWLAMTRIGALSVPLSTFAPANELARTLRHTDVAALLAASQFADASLPDLLEEGLIGLVDSTPELALSGAPFLRWIHIEDEVRTWSRTLPAAAPDAVVDAAQSEVFPSDSLVIINTSGATAAPKAVVHSHGSLVRHGALLAHRRGLTPKDRIYSPMPFFWVGGMTMVLLSALPSGAAGVVQERFDAGEALDLIERERVTQVSCWPNAARQMADHPSFANRDLTSVRGGTLVEALPAEIRPAAPDLAPMPLGMTETGGPHTSVDDPYAPLPEDLRGTFGRSLPGMEHRVSDIKTGEEAVTGEEGELMVRGTFLMDGFYKRERHTVFAVDGWYPTGDLGWFGTDGYLRYTGRRTAMIKSGGSNVSPAEVEAALIQFPEVRAAFVIGIPAGDRGEDVSAVLVPQSGCEVDLTAVSQAVGTTLSSYKVPRHMRVIDEGAVPKLPTGKIDLVSLRALFATD